MASIKGRFSAVVLVAFCTLTPIHTQSFQRSDDDEFGPVVRAYLGYVGEGLVMLFVTLLTAGIGGVVMFVVGVIEGVIYLTKSDQEFHAIYEVGHKGWF